MFAKLFKWVLMALLLAALVWHYRDTELVRQRRSTIESLLSKAGLDEAAVRRYWPLEVSDDAPSASPPAPAPSVWNDLANRFNPITLLRDRMDAQKPATTP